MGKLNVLWRTIVGSQMWKHDHPGSDIDLYTCYLAPTRDILLGKNTKRYKGGRHDKWTNRDEKVVDEVKFELGHVMYQITRGNANHLWGILSPITTQTSPAYEKLKTITLDNLAKNCYNSIHGMAVHNIRDWFQRGYKFKDIAAKKLNIIGRVLQFGTHVLLGEFEKLFEVEQITSLDAIYQLLNTLDEALEQSTLTEKPDQGPFEDFLFNLRIKDVKIQNEPSHSGAQKSEMFPL